MNQELLYSLQTCLDLCERLSSELDNQEDFYVECVGGDLLKEYQRANSEARQVVAKIKEKVSFLQYEQKLEL